MRLVLEHHDVTGAEWGPTSGALGLGLSTSLGGGCLRVDRSALTDALLIDDRLLDVELQLARPGESCRIAPVFDIVQPRAKLTPPNADFPGVLSPVQPAGDGVTRVLRGLVVTVVDPAAPHNGAHIVDLSAHLDGFAGAEVSCFSDQHHLVVVPRLRPDLIADEVRNALRFASLRAAVELARTTVVDAPDDSETFELTEVDSHLSRVAYVFQLHSHQVPTVPGEPLLYGDNCRHLLPTLLHPNEVLDGGVVRSYYYMNMETFGIQNNAMIRSLYRRHGRDLNFVGVVVYVANQLADERARATVMAANLVRWTLHADGAVFTKSVGGAPHVDMAMVAEQCEKLGVRTAMITQAGVSNDGGLLFNAPTLNAIVDNAGGNLNLRAVDRIITSRPAEEADALKGPLSVSVSRVAGVVDHLGSSRLTSAQY